MVLGLKAAILCHLIGYEQNSHLHRLLDISSNSVFVGTHVIFDENATGFPLSSPFVEIINNTNILIITLML
jgi:hypothetical protein